jgi:hypothetical protein
MNKLCSELHAPMNGKEYRAKDGFEMEKRIRKRKS